MDETAARDLAIRAAQLWRTTERTTAMLVLVDVDQHDQVKTTAKPASDDSLPPQLRNWARGHEGVLALVRYRGGEQVFQVRIPPTVAKVA